MASTTNPEQNPAPRPKRRTFSAEYKLRIVAEYDAAPNGEKGAILRRERLYHSHIIEWRAARDAGGMATLADKRTSVARPKKAAEQCGCREIIRPGQAACWYSRSVPLSRSRRWTSRCVIWPGSLIGAGSGRSGAACLRARCGRCPL